MYPNPSKILRAFWRYLFEQDRQIVVIRFQIYRQSLEGIKAYEDGAN